MNDISILTKKIKLVLPTLNEKQRRIYLASEAKVIGWGGVSTIARISKTSRTTIYSGLNDIKIKNPRWHGP